MRVVLLLTCVLVGGSQARSVRDVGGDVMSVLDKLAKLGKTEGGNILQQVKEKTEQELMMESIKEALTHGHSGNKRQLDHGVGSLQDPDGNIYLHADELKHALQVALNTTTHLQHPENYQQTIQDFLDQIDNIVASHSTTIEPLALSRRENVAAIFGEELSQRVTSFMEKLKHALQTNRITGALFGGEQ